MNKCFKIKRGTDFDKSVKKHFALLPKWNNMYQRVSKLLGENITKLALTTDTLCIDYYELTKEENKKLFKKDGTLRANLKSSKQLMNLYKDAIKEEGLEEYEELRMINFCHGIMRTSGQRLESFITSEDDIYYKADFDLEKKTGGLVEPISEIEYQEKYLKELKNQEQANA